MPVTTTLAQLWQREELPIRDALYLADGRAYAVAQDEQAPGGLSVNEEFDLDAQLAKDPEWVTSIVVSNKVELRDGTGSLCCGEGSWGSEGIFARLAPNGEPVWVVYLERSNPFTDIDIRNQVARFRSSSGLSVSVTATGTDFTPTPWPEAE
jgi:hypothetical protein